ncbi:MAG TPA: RNA 3'-terminal phosphate cyclase [Anaerolineales bacterium]|jgi:RNA 3'-terminal phosphate cyclase (ATP)
MIQIDGSLGEGGGQVLRSSLTLSLLTKYDFQITNIRSRRSNPGLRAQHLKAVEAAASVGRAGVQGAELGSTALSFHPEAIHPGRYSLEISTAGAASLVLQTIFLPLALAGAGSTITITGGTHVNWSPSYHYLELQWLPFMRRIGFNADLKLQLAGFYPEGGGHMTAAIPPNSAISPLHITERGRLRQIRGISAIANLPRHIAERQREQVIRRLGDRFYLNDIRLVELPARFKGTMLLLLAEFEKSQACYFSLGEIGKPAERVADDAVDQMEEFLSTDGAIDQYLADQLLLPLALARGQSELRTSKITQHLLTNAEVIRQFLPVTINIAGRLGEAGLVSIER